MNQMSTSLHRIEIAWASGAICDIEWAGGAEGEGISLTLGTQAITGWPELLPDAVGRAGVPAISLDHGVVTSLFEPLRLREQTDYLLDFRLRSSHSAAIREWQSNPCWPLSDRFSTVYKTLGPRHWRVEGEYVRVVGNLNFGSFAGVAVLDLPQGERLPLEVVCTKLGYVEDFKELLEQVGHEVVELLLTAGSPTAVPLLASTQRADSSLTFLFHLRAVLTPDSLPAAIESILRHPHEQMRDDRKDAFVWEFAHPDIGAMSRATEFLPDLGSPAESPTCLPVPIRYFGRSRTTSRNTAENRYVKAFLEELLRRAESGVTSLRSTPNTAAVRELGAYASQIRDWVLRPFWRDVGPFRHLPSNSQVLQRRADYRRVLDADLRLHLGLTLPWTPTTAATDRALGDLRSVDVIYEYWCFLVVRRLLASICGSGTTVLDDVLVKSAGGFDLQLMRGKQSRTVFEFGVVGVGKCRIELYFNRRFAGGPPAIEGKSYSVGLRPDISMCIERVCDGAVGPRHWLHFDAKYRREIDVVTLVAAANGAPTASDEYDKVEDTYKRADLYKMHTYRDALVASRGAYALFPSTASNECVFVKCGSATSDKVPSVGVFPLIPARASQNEAVLREFLVSALSQIVSTTWAVDERMSC